MIKIVCLTGLSCLIFINSANACDPQAITEIQMSRGVKYFIQTLYVDNIVQAHLNTPHTSPFWFEIRANGPTNDLKKNRKEIVVEPGQQKQLEVYAFNEGYVGHGLNPGRVEYRIMANDKVLLHADCSVEHNSGPGDVGIFTHRFTIFGPPRKP